MAVRVPWQRLDPATLRRLVEEYVTRDGTDYGLREVDVETRVAQVLTALRRGEAFVTFDPRLNSATIIKATDGS